MFGLSGTFAAPTNGKTPDCNLKSIFLNRCVEENFKNLSCKGDLFNATGVRCLKSNAFISFGSVFVKGLPGGFIFELDKDGAYYGLKVSERIKRIVVLRKESGNFIILDANDYERSLADEMPPVVAPSLTVVFKKLPNNEVYLSANGVIKDALSNSTLPFNLTVVGTLKGKDVLNVKLNFYQFNTINVELEGTFENVKGLLNFFKQNGGELFRSELARLLLFFRFLEVKPKNLRIKLTLGKEAFEILKKDKDYRTLIEEISEYEKKAKGKELEKLKALKDFLLGKRDSLVFEIKAEKPLKISQILKKFAKKGSIKDLIKELKGYYLIDFQTK